MKKININNLKKGDIVLTTSSSKKTSGIIRTVTNSDISHAMICVSYGSVIDSTGDGIQARNIQKILYDDSCAIHILRTKEPLSEEIIDQITDYARSLIGTRYSVFEAAASVAPKLMKKSGSKQFCSRMVARSYAYAGVSLVVNPDYCTPNDIKKSELLFFVDEPSVQVDEEEIQVIKNLGDTTEGMRNVTNQLLSELREIEPSIESINDIDGLIVRRPELDPMVSKILKESGYLDFWKVELSRFPWRYDPLKIVQFYHALKDPEVLLDYCHETIKQDRNGDFKHWQLNAQVYRGLHERFNLETFALYAELYLKIYFHHELRVKSANVLLQIYGSKVS